MPQCPIAGTAWDTNASFDVKQLTSETFFPDNLLASTKETKPNATEVNIMRNTKILNKHKNTKARFDRLVRLGRRTGLILPLPVPTRGKCTVTIV